MKNLNDLTIDELKQVFYNNEKLQNDVLEFAHRDVDIDIRDLMSFFKNGAIDCNIGYPGDYITIKNECDFMDGIKELQLNHCYLGESFNKKIKQCEKMIVQYNDCASDVDNEKLGVEINELLHEIKEKLLEQFKAEYNYFYNKENLCNFFIDAYVDCMNGDFYVDDNYILYEHIEFEKCYK